MMFELQIISLLSDNEFIRKGVTEHRGKPAIFPYYIPKDAAKPYILFLTANYDVPTKSESKLLTVNYLDAGISFDESQRISNEIVRTIDGLSINSEKYGELRFYLSGNPQHVVTKESVHSVIVSFIVRGALKNWGIV